MRKKYMVVRSYDDGNNYEKLQRAFDSGFEFVRASEYIPEAWHDKIRRYGYIEYILCREEE